MWLLDKAGLSTAARSNPTQIVRTISAMVSVASISDFGFNAWRSMLSPNTGEFTSRPKLPSYLNFCVTFVAHGHIIRCMGLDE